MTNAHYIGRFAPSPSGELHFGSLIAALGSYLRARSQHGIWRVRIEDIDPPREVPGAAETILRQLEHYGLHWDGDILWQSQRHDAYRDALAWLRQQNLSYYCTCPRARIQRIGGVYDGHCRTLQHGPENAAVRIKQFSPVMQFHDVLRGDIQADPLLAREDFIIHRRDGLFAYNLAVVVDDHFQGVTEIVRGADLIARRTIFICRWRSTNKALNFPNRIMPQPCRRAIHAPYSLPRCAFWARTPRRNGRICIPTNYCSMRWITGRLRRCRNRQV